MIPAIILHGTPDKEEYFSPTHASQSNSHWLPWLQRELIHQGFLAQTPEMPRAYTPNYTQWKETFEQFSVSNESVLIGHSCGGGFLVRYLSEHTLTVKRLILVAPWLDPDRRKDPEFFNFSIDRTLPRRTDIHLLRSDNDHQEIKHSENRILKALPSIYLHEFTNAGHFCHDDMGTSKFPELRNISLYGTSCN